MALLFLEDFSGYPASTDMRSNGWRAAGWNTVLPTILTAADAPTWPTYMHLVSSLWGFAMVNDTLTQDAAVEYRTGLTVGSHRAGILLRNTSVDDGEIQYPNNGFGCQVFGDGRVSVFTNGMGTLLDDLPAGSFAPSDWGNFRLGFAAIGSSLKVYIDGVEIFEVTNSGQTQSGRAGCLSFNNSIRVTDFKIGNSWPIEPETPASLPSVGGGIMVVKG